MDRDDYNPPDAELGPLMFSRSTDLTPALLLVWRAGSGSIARVG